MNLDAILSGLRNVGNRIANKSEIYKAAKAGFTAPVRALRGEIDPFSPEALQEAAGTAGLATTGAFPLAPKATSGVVGTIIGPRAKLFDRRAAKEAANMLRDKASMSEVKQATGTEFTRNGQPFQELSDEDLAINLDPKVRNLEDVLGKDAPYFEAYPHLRKHGFKITAMPEDVMGESAATKIKLNSNQTLNEQLAVVKHEINHPIQKHEGFEPGGSVTAVSDMYNPTWGPIAKAIQQMPQDMPVNKKLALLQAQGLRTNLRKDLTVDDLIAAQQWQKYRTTKNIPTFDSAYAAYAHLLGEAQADAALARSTMSAKELRKVPIEETYKLIGRDPNKITAHRIGNYQWPISYPKDLLP